MEMGYDLWVPGFYAKGREPNQGPRMTFEDNNVNFVYRSSLRIRYENIRKYRIIETGANWKSESLQRTLRGEGEGNRSIQVDPQLDVQPG